MEDLLGAVFVIIAIVSSIMKKQQKAQGRKAARQQIVAKKEKQWPTLEQSVAQWFDDAQTAPAQPAVAKPDAQSVTHEGMHPCDEHSSAPAAVAQPRIQTRVQVTEKPQVMLGSMGVDTHEGSHPCDEHEAGSMQDVKPLVPIPVETPGIQLDWSGENMVKAFIMQEVLTRPCDRRRHA